MTNKLDRLQSFIDLMKAKWLLISDPIEVRYITGIKSSNMQLLIGCEEAHLFTDFRYTEIAQKYCSDEGWIFHELIENSAKEISDIFSEDEDVIIQSDLLSVDQFEQFQKYSPETNFLRNGKEISALFSIKTDWEISDIEQAALIADTAFTKWQKLLDSEISEQKAAELLESICREEGSLKPSFDTIVLFGKNSALPHGVPSENRKLKHGDTILVDFGCTVNGFCSDMTRTLYFKSVSDSLKERYNLTLKAQRAGVAALKPGVTAASIDNIVRTIINNVGFGDYFGHGTGHGVGLRIHERPALNSRDMTILAPGMVVTVEPGIYIPNDGGVRIEDLLVITENGCRSLSNSCRELKLLH